MRVVEARDRHPELVLLAGERDPVLRERQQLAERAEHRPVVVVAHVLPERGAAMTVCEDVLGPSDRERADRLDREAAGEATRLVGLVEVLRGNLRRRALVHAQELREARRDLRSALHHHVAPHLVGVVAEPVSKASGGRVEQQARRLDRIAGDADGSRPLEPLASIVHVADAAHASARLVELDLNGHRVGTDLGSVLESIGNVGDKRARLRVHLAAL